MLQSLSMPIHNTHCGVSIVSESTGAVIGWTRPHYWLPLKPPFLLENHLYYFSWLYAVILVTSPHTSHTPLYCQTWLKNISCFNCTKTTQVTNFTKILMCEHPWERKIIPELKSVAERFTELMQSEKILPYLAAHHSTHAKKTWPDSWKLPPRINLKSHILQNRLQLAEFK